MDKSEEPKALVSVDSMLNWSDHESDDMEKGASEVYGMLAGYGDDVVIPAVDAADRVSTDGIFDDGVFGAVGNGSDGVSVAAGVGADGVSVTSSNATDAETQFSLMGLSPQVQSCPFGCNYIYTELKKDFDNLEVQYKECFIQVQAYKSSLQNLEQQKSWYQNNQSALEEKIRILTVDLGNTTNMLKYTEKLNEQAISDNMNNKVKLEESEARFDKWKNSFKNLTKLINSSMSSRSKFGLGYGDTFGTDEVFDLFAPSIFDWILELIRFQKPCFEQGLKTMERTGSRFAYHLGRDYVLLLVLGTRSERARLPPLLDPTRDFWADYGFVATIDMEIMQDLERDVGYGITDTWEEMPVDMPGAPATDDIELGRRMIEFATRVRQDTDEQTER
ncbi:hypothetical protein Tco_0762072 [Tanacetum coccineum]